MPRSVEDSYLIDDLCKEVGIKNRHIDRSVRMLEDALHALRHGSPEVTDEYLERVICDLREVRE